MSGAIEALQEAVVTALSGIAPIYDGPPPRADFPYIVMSESPVTDWSTKTATGREIRLALTIWDNGEEPARLRTLTRQVEDALQTLPRDLPGWRIASSIFVRSLTSRSPAGPWAVLIEQRMRMLGAG